MPCVGQYSTLSLFFCSVFLRISYLKCKETTTNGCTATGSILRNDDNVFTLRRLHTHPVRPLKNELRHLRSALGDQSVQKIVHSYSAHNLYMEAIIR